MDVLHGGFDYMSDEHPIERHVRQARQCAERRDEASIAGAEVGEARELPRDDGSSGAEGVRSEE